MSKALSNGTMSLRFMQNAQRAKQQAQVELEQAKIKDEAEWEVSQDVKDAWGIGSSSDASTSSVTYESSYLPFIFTSPASGVSDNVQAKPKGRRSFNTKGKEIDAAPEKDDAELANNNGTPNQSGEHSLKRPTTISGFKTPLPIKTNLKTNKGPTAQELIRDNVGKRPPAPLRTDNTPSLSSAQPTAKTVQVGFLKPSGVDGPSLSSVARASKGRTQEAQGGGSPGRKRDRGEVGDQDGKKRRKKKDKSSGVRMID